MNINASYSYSECALSSAGAKIVLSLWEAEKADAALVFVPGTMLHPLYYGDFLAAIAQRGFSVVGVHPIGHGKSPRSHRLYTLADIMENARDAVGFAIERYRLPVILSGSSQGGIVAAAVASADSRVAAAFPHNLMFMDMPGALEIVRLPKLLRRHGSWTQAMLRFSAALFPWFKIPMWMYLDPKKVAGNGYVRSKISSDPYMLTGYSLKFIASLATARFPSLTDGSASCPFYSVWSTEDSLFTPEYSQRSFERVIAPYKEEIVFEGLGHMMMVSNPSQVAERMASKMREALEWRASNPPPVPA
jgi:alpha-beta hydrolase superfamily lysophospholipase